MRLISIFLIALLLSSTFTYGQPLTAKDSLQGTQHKIQAKGVIKEQQLKDVEVRAVRVGADAPFAKTNITGADLQKTNLGQDLPYLLQYTPSAVTTSDAGTGIGYTGLRIRGSDASRTNITMNGLPVNDPEEQSVFFVDLPDIASSTGSVQIQRGVGTSTNGAGAFGATISITNLKQFDTAGVTFSSSVGSFNTLKNTLSAGTGLLKNGWQFDVRLSKINSDGYVNRGSSDLKSMQFTAGWKASEKTTFHFMVMTGTEKTGQAWDGVDSLTLATNRRYNELGLKRDGTFYNNQTDNYQQDYYQLFADHAFSNHLTGHVGLFLTRGKGYYQVYDTSQLAGNYIPNGDSTRTADVIQQLWLDNYYYGGVFSFLYQRGKTQVTLGGGLTEFDNRHYGIITWSENGGFPADYKWYEHDDHKNDLNIYLKAQQPLLKNLFLYGDVQFRNIRWAIDGFQDHPDLKPDLNYNFFNPKAGLTYLLRNTTSLREKLYASFAVGNREAMYADFEVDPQHLPLPETLYDYEGGYEINRRKWSAGANLYYMHYYNQLVLTGQINDVGAYTQVNVPNSYRTGIELQGIFRPVYWLTVGGNATFSQNKILNFNEAIDNYATGGQDTIKHSVTNIGFSPEVIASGSVAFMPFRHLSYGQQLELDILGKYVSKQYLDNASNDNRSLPHYGLLSVMVRYTVKARPFKEITASLLVNNILNAQYSSNGYAYAYKDLNGIQVADNRYFPQAGRNVLGGLTFKW